MTDALRRAFADEWGRLVAHLARLTGDLALAEDCAQEAFAAAAVAWSRDGEPRSPGAWLTTVGRNRALDALRRRSTERAAIADLSATRSEEEPMEPDEVPDDRLRLIFTCCHPALPLEARVALTLRTLCGLTPAEIGAAFGVGEEAMAKRLVRARRKIRLAAIPYRVPSGRALPERIAGVLAVLYVLFTEGYAPSGGGDATRPDLSGEAIRLTRLVAALLPDEPEASGLLALELFQDSRRAARTAEGGSLVPLEEQDPGAWDAGRMAEARAVLARAHGGGPYVLQARIAAEHARGPAADRAAVVRGYDALLLVQPSPWAALARAVAVGLADGPDHGLAALATIRDEPALRLDPAVPAAEADLLRRAGRRAEAASAYRVALGLVRNGAQRAYLRRRLAEVER